MTAPHKLRIPTAAVFEPLLGFARDKAAFGGRGSGKSHFFAGLGAEYALRWPGEAGEGLRMVCIREVQKTLKRSAKKLIEDKLQDFGLGEAQGFKVFREVIQLPGDGIVTFQGMQDHTADSIKSLEGFHVAWSEEAQSISDRSMTLLRPTIRWEDPTRGLSSELWWSWNPTRATDPVDRVFRGDNAPTGSVVVKANWSDNPWFPRVLEQERLDCLHNTPERYGHIWEGEYATVLEGAYYARHLNEAQLQNRIGFFGRDPLLPVFTFWDIGGTSGKSDATAIWVVQFVGAEVRVLDYYEAVGQPFDAHIRWLGSNGYGQAICILPHDGRKHDIVYQTKPESYLREVGYQVQVIANQGAGAATQRIDAVRRLFPSIRFNAETTKAGREALGWYHEKRDDKRAIGLGPNHDWASHACLVAGTLVETARGPMPIETIVAGDRVLTPAGVATVSNSGVSKISDTLLEVSLSDGTVLTMTPEHKVFTTSGVVTADTLGYGDAVISHRSAPCLESGRVKSMGYRAAFIESFGAKGFGCGLRGAYTRASVAECSDFFTARHLACYRGLKQPQMMETGKTLIKRIGQFARVALRAPKRMFTLIRYSTAFDIIAGLTAGIMQGAVPAANSCTVSSGRIRTGRSPLGITFTTSTATRQTIASKILNAFLHLTTPSATRQTVNGLAATGIENNCAKLASAQRLGTEAQRGANGIHATERNLGKTALRTSATATSAARNTKRLIQSGQCSAPSVVSVRTIARAVPVYDLTVDHDHCYFANGVLVSNSDAFGLMAVYHASRDPKGKAWDKPVRRKLAGV